MGIEPTSHDSRRSSTGFEDQAHHQTGRASTAQLKSIPHVLPPEDPTFTEPVYFLFLSYVNSFPGLSKVFFSRAGYQ